MNAAPVEKQSAFPKGIPAKEFLKKAPIVAIPVIAGSSVAIAKAVSASVSEDGENPVPPFKMLMHHLETNKGKYVRPDMSFEERKEGLAKLLRSCPPN